MFGIFQRCFTKLPQNWLTNSSQFSIITKTTTHVWKSQRFLKLKLFTKMRPLTEEETKIFFEKLSKYIGDNIKSLIDRSDGTYCFRLHRERVYYVSEKIMKQVRIFTFLFLGLCISDFDLLLGFKCSKRSPRIVRHLLWQIHQDQKISSTHHSFGFLSPLRNS